MRNKCVRISSICIKNYRGIDELEIVFPNGRMAEDLDVNVMGSKNGVGKTSVLECCALILLVASSGKEVFESSDFAFDDFVKSGCDRTSISATVDVNGEKNEVLLEFDSHGRATSTGLLPVFNGRKGRISRRIFEGITGMLPDPVVGKCFLFLHSYRKVTEGRPELGMLLDEDTFDHYEPRRMGLRYVDRTASFSMFKRLIVRHLMENADLFEVSSLKKNEKDKDALAVLNGLLRTYASVRVGKLRPYRNNTIDVQVERLAEPGKGFSIDGLSSGQKEVISTLFLIWSSTYKSPTVVLIDEPEMHLNMQWHANFIRKLKELAPDNQYILATHAEGIMASVPKTNRVMLIADNTDESEPV